MRSDIILEAVSLLSCGTSSSAWRKILEIFVNWGEMPWSGDSKIQKVGKQQEQAMPSKQPTIAFQHR